MLNGANSDWFKVAKEREQHVICTFVNVLVTSSVIALIVTGFGLVSLQIIGGLAHGMP